MKLTARFFEAVAYAGALHADQKRKVSGTPYLAHLLSVAAITLEHGAAEDEAIAALLHDAVEDQQAAGAREEIRRRFGPVVAEIVDGCTETDQMPKPPWRPRKQAHLDRLRSASASVRLISAADKLDNVRSLLLGYRLQGRLLWGHFGGGREGTLWYHRTAVGILKAAGTNSLIDELDRAVLELERLVLDECRDFS